MPEYNCEITTELSADSPEEAAELLVSWVKDWAESQIFVGVEESGKPHTYQTISVDAAQKQMELPLDPD